MNNLKTFKNINTVYCSGCFHGIINRILGEAIDSLDIRSDCIGVNSSRCSSFISDYMNLDFVEAPLGHSISVARGIKNVHSDKVIFTYQEEGDLLDSGMNELIHSANIGENITVIMVNNLVNTQSGGQMSSTTLVGQITETTPYGRSIERHGQPIKIAEMIAKMSGSAYVCRVTVDTNERIRQAEKALKDAISFQLEGKGFSFVEFMSMCPTYWDKSPIESRKWLREKVMKEFPIGLIKRTNLK